MSTPVNTPDENTSLLVAVARLETKVEALQEAVKQLATGQQTGTGTAVPVTGGVVGLAAAVWTLYAQLTGKA